MRNLRLLALASLVMTLAQPLRSADTDADAGFAPIFDGKTLDGWTAPDMTFWRVEDRAITGEVTGDHLPKENVFLVWKGEPVGDFELRFRFRITGEAANSGMQFRSEVKERGLVHGYQADMSGDGKWTGGIFDEYGPRGSLAARGESVTWSHDGKKTVASLPDGDKESWPLTMRPDGKLEVVDIHGAELVMYESSHVHGHPKEAGHKYETVVSLEIAGGARAKRA